MDQAAYTTKLMKFVIPATAAITTIYSTGFTYAVATAPEPVGERKPTDFVSSGEIKPGWRYEIFGKSWPKSYTLDVRSVSPGSTGVCAVDVRGYPKPVAAMPGPGTSVRVLFDKPLEGLSSSVLTIDLMSGTRLSCAVRVNNGVVLDPQAVVTPPAPPVIAKKRQPIARAGQPGLAI